MLRRIGAVIIVVLVPFGAAGFAAVTAGPQNVEVDSVLPPGYVITDYDGTEIHSAWLTLLVAIGWATALLLRRGPWNDAGRACLALGLGVGAFWASDTVFAIFLVYAVPLGLLVSFIATSLRSVRRFLIALATGLWVFAGLLGWLAITPPGWIVLLVMPAVWPLGAILTRGRPADSPRPTR